MPNDALRVIDTASRITALVNDVWEAVAHTATLRADAARAAGGSSKP